MLAISTGYWRQNAYNDRTFFTGRSTMSLSAKKSGKKRHDLGDDVGSDAIAAQTAAFLAGGGKINQIKAGVSGQYSSTGNKQITLGKKPER